MDGIESTTGITAPSADAVLEMTGLSEAAGATCALLTPAIKARMRALRSGQVLEVRVDDPAAREDIASWSRLSGHELLAVIEAPPRTLCFYLRKKSD
ncbi:MAG TPA: sulfurtransferase TusA family protein [Ktedonobacterales bacterium]|jgi:TusA-related sulfurtransferase|nr:sulfurtransferase TusA family protein [Ktedonobacterales bacterium]